MISKYLFYRIAFPVRSSRQRKLKSLRLSWSIEQFFSELGQDVDKKIAGDLYNRLRDLAFVPDFAPSASDDLYKLYGLDGAEILDEIIEPIASTVRFSEIGLPDLEGLRRVEDVYELLVSRAASRG